METKDVIMLRDMLTDLQEQIDALSTTLKDQKKSLSYRSEDIKDLSTALSKAQGEFAVAQLNRQNPYFKSKYADLLSVVSSARPALAKYGLSVVQDIIVHDDGSNVLHTILLHSTGQYIESRMKILPVKSDIQSISSHVTYLKRLTYASLVGVVTGDEDDDGEVAVATERETFAKGTSLNATYKPQENQYVTVSKDQIAELELELENHPQIAEMVLEGLKIQSIADMPKGKYSAAIQRIRQIKLDMKNK